MSIHGRKLQVLLTLASFTEVTGFCGSKHLTVQRDRLLFCGREQLMAQCECNEANDMIHDTITQRLALEIV